MSLLEKILQGSTLSSHLALLQQKGRELIWSRMEIMKYFFSKNQRFLLLAWEFVGGGKLKDDIVIDIGVWMLALKSQYRGQVGGKKS